MKESALFPALIHQQSEVEVDGQTLGAVLSYLESICMRVYVYMSVRVYVYMCACVRVYVYMCVCVCMCEL